MATAFDRISATSVKGICYRSGSLYGIAEDGIVMISPSTGLVTSKLSEVGGHAIAYDDTMDLFLVAGRMLGNSVVFSVSPSGQISGIVVSQFFHGIAYNMGFLYGCSDNGLFKITVSDGTTARLSGVSGRDTAICGTDLYVSDPGAGIWTCDITTGAITAVFDELECQALGYDIDNQKLWASEIGGLYSIACASGGGGGPSSDSWVFIGPDNHHWIGGDNAIWI